jgi:hypothetical protein
MLTASSTGFNTISAFVQLGAIYMIGSKPYVNSTLMYDGMKPESRFLCQNVKIISFEHASINFIAVVIIVLGTALLAAISFSKSWVACWPKSRWFYHPSWIETTPLNLLKLATPDLPWAQTKARDIPVTMPVLDSTSSSNGFDPILEMSRGSRFSQPRKNKLTAELYPVSGSGVGLAVSSFRNSTEYSRRPSSDVSGRDQEWI